jgi:hypothetical protein
MKPETLGIFGFFVSLIAFLLVGLLVFISASSSSSSQFAVSSILPIVVIFAIIGALLTGLKVYAVERS